MTIKFCGAAQEVTGSAHLITLNNGYKILLDCGLYQGNSQAWKAFNEHWLFDPADIDVLILSHAHIDHTGRVPKLVKDGFKGDIHATHATRSLCALMLMDSAKIQESDAAYYNKRQLRKYGPQKARQRQPLYTAKDAEKALEYFVGHSYEHWCRLNDQVEILFRDAGHILGSASVTLRITEQGHTTTIGFTGDIGRPNRPIIRDPKPMPEVDYLICESTYGNKDHLGAPDELEEFLQVIHETCVVNKGRLIIPAFSVGRTQEIVYMLDRLENAGKLPRIPVYVDSPLSVNVTTIFGAHPECFDQDMQDYLLIDDNPFGFNKLSYVRSVEGSKAINASQEPCIIISSSGMMNAGRVQHHLANNIGNPKNTFLLVGYATPSTPGGALRSGAKRVKVLGEEHIVRAKVVVMDSFSAHADRGELLDFLHNQKASARNIFLVHGTLDRQEPFQQTLLDEGFTAVTIPAIGDEVQL